MPCGDVMHLPFKSFYFRVSYYLAIKVHLMCQGSKFIGPHFVPNVEMKVIRFAFPIIISPFMKALNYFTSIFESHFDINFSLSDSQEIIKLCQSLKIDIKKSEYGKSEKKTAASIDRLVDAIKSLSGAVEKLRIDAHLYDLPGGPCGNGYHTFVLIADRAAATVWQSLLKLKKKRRSTSQTITEITELTDLITSLAKTTNYLLKLKSGCHDGSLYHSQDVSMDELLDLSEDVAQECFYGRYIANQFSASMQFILKQISWHMVWYSELYYGAPLVRVVTRAIKYAFSDLARGKRHLAITHHAGIDFTKAFWKLAECPFVIWPMLLTNPIAVSQEISFPVTTVQLDGKDVKPTLDNTSEIRGRLISKTVREGMSMACGDCEKKSPHLLIYVHGGGFVSQSTRTQEIFLRKWANSLDVPIFSIDYSLAPESPFPQAVQEVFIGYCLALANSHKLGSTAERVIFAGDSAGANLVLGAIQECISRNVRLPHGMFLAYVPVLVSFVPSPARLMGLLDPLLPFGVMIRCAKAYVLGTSSIEPQPPVSTCQCIECNETSQLTFLDNPHLKFCRDHFIANIPCNSFISPYETPDEILQKMPPIFLCSSTFDPCLDDTIMFAKKLQKLGKSVTFEIMEGLSHGFLNFCWVNENAEKATRACGDRIALLLQTDTPTS